MNQNFSKNIEKNEWDGNINMETNNAQNNTG